MRAQLSHHGDGDRSDFDGAAHSVAVLDEAICRADSSASSPLCSPGLSVEPAVIRFTCGISSAESSFRVRNYTTKGSAAELRLGRFEGRFEGRVWPG